MHTKCQVWIHVGMIRDCTACDPIRIGLELSYGNDHVARMSLAPPPGKLDLSGDSTVSRRLRRAGLEVHDAH